MQIIGRTEDKKRVLAAMTDQEAQLLGCLEDAWNDVVTTDGPPGRLWYEYVDLDPALRAVLAFTELLARSNGLRLAMDAVDEMLRKGEPKADGLPRLPWKETEAYKIMRHGEPGLIEALGRSYARCEFDGTGQGLSKFACGEEWFYTALADYVQRNS